MGCLADRRNSRVVILDNDGTFLTVWKLSDREVSSPRRVDGLAPRSPPPPWTRRGGDKAGYLALWFAGAPRA